MKSSIRRIYPHRRGAENDPAVGQSALPAKDKMTHRLSEHYGGMSFPDAALPDGAGTLRVIAGSYGDIADLRIPFRRLNVWDMRS